MPVHFGLMPTETRMGDELSMGQAIVVFWQPQSSPDQFINTLNAIFDQANILLRQENVKLINNPTR